MESPVWTIPDNYRTVLTLASYAVIALGGLWLVTSVIGYFHRRSYNLTHAESGRSENIKPDFLKVDKAARDAAMARGAAYDKQLAEREAAAAGAPAPTAQVGRWAQIGATVTAVFTLIAAIVGTLTKVEALGKGIDNLSSWDKLSAIFREYPLGVTVAVVVVAANIIGFSADRKKKKRA